MILLDDTNMMLRVLENEIPKNEMRLEREKKMEEKEEGEKKKEKKEVEEEEEKKEAE